MFVALLKEKATLKLVSCRQFVVFANCQIERAFRSIVIVNPGRFTRGAAISSLDRTLFMMKYDSEPEEIATSQKHAPRDDTDSREVAMIPDGITILNSGHPMLDSSPR